MTRGFPYFACLAMAASTALGQQAADPYKEAVRYRFDQPRTAVVAIEAEIRSAKTEQLRVIEGKLLNILQSPEATTDAKAWVCRQLRQAGSEQSVDALVPLLADKDLAFPARLALQSIPGRKVDEALRNAIGTLKGDSMAGVLQTIGVRSDRQAVPLVAAILASHKDLVVAEAALFALGHIGGADALRAVQAAKVSDSLNRSRCHAILLCAERMAADGQTTEAAAAYQSLHTESKDMVITIGALRGIVLCDKERAAPALLSALKSDQRRLRAAAVKFLCEECRGATLAAVMAELPTLRPGTQAAILAMVADKAALPAVLKAAKSDNPAVRRATAGALGRIGDASHVPSLLSMAAHDSKNPYGPPGAMEAYASLQVLRGPGVAEALIAAAEQGKPAERRAAVQALAGRGQTEAVPVLLKVAEMSDGELQGDAFLALGMLADRRAVPSLVELLVRAKGQEPRISAQNALIAVCSRIAEKNEAAQAVAGGLNSPSMETRRSAVTVLAHTPSAKALEVLRGLVNDGDFEISETALRGLAAWPDATAAADLLAIARTENHLRRKVLALQGAIRLAGPAGKLPAAQAIRLLTDAMGLAERAEEKRLILAALADVKDAAAIELAARYLPDQALEVEAASAVVKIAKSLRATNPDAAAAAIQKVLDVCKSPAARQLAEGAMVVLGGMVNIAPQGTATSPDGIEKDGAAGDDQAAIDGDPATYWDEADGQKVYRLVVTFKQPEKVAAISILGYAHHNFAPKDFEVLCDGRVAKKVENAQYDSNFLLVRLDETTCKTVELKITGYHGNSPAIRELGVYRTKTQK